MIIGSIVSLVYPVKSSRRGSRRSILSNLEARLDQWYLELPDNLRYDLASKRNTPPAPVLYIHIKYWFAVLLLHRALWVVFLIGGKLLMHLFGLVYQIGEGMYELDTVYSGYLSQISLVLSLSCKIHLLAPRQRR